MTSYIDLLEPGVRDDARGVDTVAALSQAISLKRIADSLATLTEVAIHPVVTAHAATRGPDIRTYKFKWEDNGSLTVTDEDGRVEIVKPAPKADDNPWIEWGGDSLCPVPGETMVDVKFRNGEVNSCTRAMAWAWASIGGDDYEIAAYRISK